MLPNCSEFQSQKVQTYGYAFHVTNWPTSWSNTEHPAVPLERNLYSHPLDGLLSERQFEEVLLGLGWEKVPNWECLFVHRKQGLFFSVYVDDIKMAGKKQNVAPMWKILMKNVDLQRQDSAIYDLCLKMVTHLQRQGNTIGGLCVSNWWESSLRTWHKGWSVEQQYPNGPRRQPFQCRCQTTAQCRRAAMDRLNKSQHVAAHMNDWNKAVWGLSKYLSIGFGGHSRSDKLEPPGVSSRWWTPTFDDCVLCVDEWRCLVLDQRWSWALTKQDLLNNEHAQAYSEDNGGSLS